MMSPLARYVLRNLTSRGYSAAIAAGTMAIVGFSITSTLAFGLGLRAAFSAKAHDNRVVVLSGETPTPFYSDLPLDALTRIAASAESTGSSIEIVDELETHTSDGTIELQTLRGLDPAGFEMHGARLVEGRLPSKGEQELALGVTLAARHPELSLGSSVRVGNQLYKTVGLFETDTSEDGEAWISREALARMLRRTSASMVLIDTAGPPQALALAARLERTRKPLLKAMVEPGYFAEQFAEFRGLYDALWLILGLVLLGAGFAATSILTIAFGRRVSELALLRALGFRKRRAATLLFVETELIALGGGLLGALAAAVALHNYVAYSLAGGGIVNFRVHMTPAVLGGAALLIALLGALSSALPIMRASRPQIRDGLSA